VKRRLPGLWTEIAGALSLVTLAVLVLNAGVLWLVLEQAEVRRRSDLALSLSGALSAQLSMVEAADAAGYGVVLDAYRNTTVDFGALFLVDRAMQPLVVVSGDVPTKGDPGIRAALYGRETHVEIVGSFLDERSVVVTEPIKALGAPQAALRISLPLRGPEVPGGAFGFSLLYVLASGGMIGLFGWARFRRSVVGPFHRIKASTERIAGGEFGHRLEDEPVAEIQGLVESLNEMGGYLERFRAKTAGHVATLEAANEELQRAQEALIRAEKLAGVGRMAAGVAHELGNPLAAVVGYVDLLAQGVDSKTETEIIGRAGMELQRIHRTIQALLGYARVGTGEVEVIDVGDLLRDAVLTVQAQPSFSDIQVRLEVAPNLGTVSLERDKLHQVLVNLLVNAAAAPGVRNIGLLAESLAENALEIRCEDDGAGFSEVALDRAFEPFFTTKDVGEGTGLGLATAMQVISGGGGGIAVSNLSQGGACVRIRLPYSPAP
jgi:signal transduction histidine kinase